MRSIVSAVVGLVLLGSPIVASAQPLARDYVRARPTVVTARRPVVVAPAFGHRVVRHGRRHHHRHFRHEIGRR